MANNKIVFLVYHSHFAEMFKKISQKLSEDSFKLLCYGTEAEEALLEFVRHERPIGVVLDPVIGEPHLENICNSVSDAIGTFDMYCRIYALGDTIKFPGVTVITEEDFQSLVA